MKRIIMIVILATLLTACSTTLIISPTVMNPGHLIIGAATSNYASFVSSTNIQPTVVENYDDWFQSFDASFAGPSEPLIQIEPKNVSLTAISTGKYDTWLRFFADQVITYHKPVILGFAPEMNGTWYTWGYTHIMPAIYIAAWRHVISIFKSVGANNVTWMWTVNNLSSNISDPAMWWPGSSYVNLVGIDAYYDTVTQTFATTVAPTVTNIKAFWNGPVILSETAVIPGSEQASKIKDLFIGAVDYHLTGLIWFDLPGNHNWVLQTQSAIAEFRKEAQQYS